MTRDAILLMAYGSPDNLDQVEAYYTDIRRGSPPPPHLLEELKDRYRAIGGGSPLSRIVGEQRAAHADDAEKAGVTPPRKSIGELMDLDRATLASEDATFAVFDVPLKKDGSSGLPSDKIRLLVRIHKPTHTFDRIDGVLQKSFRSALVFKAKSGEGHIVFTSVDPLYPPVITSIAGTGTGSIFFVKLTRSYELSRTEFRRVKPYSDRFKVKLGPLKTIDF